MTSLRVPLLCVSSLALRVPATRALAVRTQCCACPCCAFPCCAPSCWTCGVLVQRSSRSCAPRSGCDAVCDAAVCDNYTHASESESATALTADSNDYTHA